MVLPALFCGKTNRENLLRRNKYISKPQGKVISSLGQEGETLLMFLDGDSRMDQNRVASLTVPIDAEKCTPPFRELYHP